MIGQRAFPKSGWLPGEAQEPRHTEWSLEGAPPTVWSLEGASTTLLVTLQFLSPEGKMRKPKTKTTHAGDNPSKPGGVRLLALYPQKGLILLPGLASISYPFGT